MVIGLGALLLADRIEVFDIEFSGSYWPVIPLALGLARLVQPARRPDGTCGSRRTGAWLVFIGGWGLLNEFHLFGLDYDSSWPLVVVFAGISIVWRATERPLAPSRAGREN
jgi:hypothetical protein